jgi:hypothetical protein
LGIVTDECRELGREQYVIAASIGNRMLIALRASARRPTGTRFKLKAFLEMKMRSGFKPMSIQPAQDWLVQPVSARASYQGARRTVSETDADILRKRALKRQRALIAALNGRARS